MLHTLKKPALLEIYIIPLVSMTVDAMTWSIFVLYALELKADIFQINLITTITSTMTILLEVPFGILSDRLGRKPMLIYTRGIIILGTLIRVIAMEPNHLIIGSLLGGLAGGDFFPLLLSMIGDVADPNDRQEAISTLFIFSSIGMLISPILCSSLLLLPQMSLRNVYQIVLVGQIAILLYIATQIHESKPKVHTNTKINYRLYLKDLIKQTNFQSLLILSALFWFSRSIISTYIQIYAKVDLNLSNAEVASFSAYSSAATMLIRILSATLLTKVPFRPTLITFLFLNGMTGFLSPFANSYVLMVLLFSLIGFSFGATRIMLSVLVANNSTHENRGVANSLEQLAGSAGNFAKIFTTPIAETLGLIPVFIFGGIIGFIAIVPLLVRKASFTN